MSTERDGAKVTANAVDAAFRPIHASIKRIEALEAKRRFLLDIFMKTNEELNADLTAEIGKLKTSTNAAQKKNRDAKKALEDLVADLRAQLAEGPKGLTEEQVNAAIASMEEVATDIDTDPEDVVTDPTGETNVPVGGNPPG